MKSKLLHLSILFFLITSIFILGCESQTTNQPNNDPAVQDIIVKPSENDKVVVPVIKQTKIIEMPLGANGENFNGNKEGLSRSLVNFGSAGRNLNEIESEKFYFEGLWDVRSDYTSFAGNSLGYIIIKTSAKTVTIELESKSYSDIKVFKGENYLPSNEAGSSVSLTPEGPYGFKMVGRNTYNLINRTSPEPALYVIRVDRPGVNAYKLTLEY